MRRDQRDRRVTYGTKAQAGRGRPIEVKDGTIPFLLLIAAQSDSFGTARSAAPDMRSLAAYRPLAGIPLRDKAAQRRPVLRRAKDRLKYVSEPRPNPSWACWIASCPLAVLFTRRSMHGMPPLFPRFYLSCNVDGCNRRPRAKGYCSIHYQRWRRTGSPHTVRKPGPKAKNPSS